MYSISTPRVRACGKQEPVSSNIAFQLRWKSNEINNLKNEVNFLRHTIEFYEVLYPFDGAVSIEKDIVVANIEPLKRKVACVKELLQMGRIDDARAELSVIPSAWRPDYMKDLDEPIYPLSYLKYRV